MSVDPASDIFVNHSLLPDVSMPVCIIHGTADNVVPFDNAEKNWNAIQDKYKWRFTTCEGADHVYLRCTHNDLWVSAISDLADYVESHGV